MKKYSNIIIIFCIFLCTGCNVPKAVQYIDISLPENTGPQAWVDAPLDNTTLPLAPYEIVFHITDQQEVTQGELSINNQVVASLPNPQAGKKLATLKYAWNPSAPGEYLLSVRAQGSSGNWGPLTTSKVFIGEPTTTVTMTMTPTGSETPTLTPTPTLSPTLTPTLLTGFTIVSAAPNAVYSGNCTPNQVTVNAQTTQTTGITAVILFYRLRDSESTSEWLNASMNLQSAGQYSKSINVGSAASDLGRSNQSGTLDYQLVIQQQNGDLIRSQVYSNVEVAACGFNLPNIQVNTVMPIPLIRTVEIVR